MRTGVLYRSAALDRVSGAGRAAMSALGLKTVVDLRSSHEVEQHGRFDPGSTGIAWVHIDSDFEPPNIDPKRMAKMLELDDPMLHFYPEMLEAGSPIFRDGLLLLAGKADVPMIVHCTSGKDRTGMFSAFVQLLCDVPVETVLREFERSGELLAHTSADLAARYPEIAGAGIEKLKAMAGVNREWVVAAIESIGGFESIESWMDSIGVTVDDRAAIRKRMIE